MLFLKNFLHNKEDTMTAAIRSALINYVRKSKRKWF